MTEPYLRGWLDVLGVIDRSVVDNEAILRGKMTKDEHRKSRGQLDALLRAQKVVAADIARQQEKANQVDEQE
jgi:hypothetical protein